MIDKTERQAAEQRIDAIKAALAESHVDFCLYETPYKLSIHLKKKFLKDHSPKSTSLNLSDLTNKSSISPSTLPNASTPILVGKDSGFYQRCSSCEDMKKTVDNAQKEIVSNILESKQKINDLQTENAKKDALINKLEKDLKKMEEDKNRIKMERDTKNEQLKNKNKALDKAIYSLEKETEQNSTSKNKIDNLEKTIKVLNSKISEKNELIKQEKLTLKNIHKKRNLKNKSTETDAMNSIDTSKPVSTQTSKTNSKTVGTSPIFTKLHIHGEPTHDITCLCLCHEDGVQQCEVQLFKYSVDSEEALDLLYYKEDYDNWSDDNELRPEYEDRINEDFSAKLESVKRMVNDEDIFKSMVKETLEEMIQEKTTETIERNRMKNVTDDDITGKNIDSVSGNIESDVFVSRFTLDT